MNDKRYLIGIEIGTTNVKTVLFDIEGREAASSGIEYDTHYIKTDYVEQNPSDWWICVTQSIRKVIEDAHADKADIGGVGISAHGTGVLPVDNEGLPLRNSIIWMDRRAKAETQFIRDHAEQEINEIYGNSVDSYHPVPAILWIKNNEPEIYRKTECFLPVESYINFKLTGVYSISTNEAGLLHVFDNQNMVWSERVASLIGIDIDKLPPLFDGSEVIGGVTKKAAEETGLAAGTPVVAGALDTPSAVLGAGCVAAGDSFLTIGTGSNFGIIIDRPVREPRLILVPHAVKQKWIIDAVMASTGSALKWFRDQFCVSEKDTAERINTDVYELINKMAGNTRPGSDATVFLPYLQGSLCPIWNNEARGVMVGMTHSTKKENIARMIMEGCAFKLRHNIEVAESNDIEVKNIRCIGGGSKSEVWNQINADITGKELLIPDISDAGPLGGAILAGTGTGILKDLHDTVGSMVRITKRYEPNKQYQNYYSDLYGVFRNIYEKLKDEFHSLSELEKKSEKLF